MLPVRLGGKPPSQQNCTRFRYHNPLIPPKGDSRPIKKLPIELLSRIFQFGTEDEWRRGVQDPVTIRASSGSYYRIQLGEVDDNAPTTDGIEQLTQSSSDARLTCPLQIAVSHVCQVWRSAAISTASLWTNIIVTPVSRPPYQQLTAFLERSKCLPINICLRFEPKKRILPSTFEATHSVADLELLYSLLIPYVHRWRFVEVRTVSNEQMYVFLSAVSDPIIDAAPQLISLALSAAQSRRDDDDVFSSLIVAANFTPFGGFAPYLESVCLENVVIDWSQHWLCYASRLTVLELSRHSDDVHPSWDEFTTILRGALALERLALNGSGPGLDVPYLDPDFDMVAWGPNLPIPLRKLTYLSLRNQPRTSVYALIRLLCMPALENFVMNFWWDDYTEFISHITAPVTVPAFISINEPPQGFLRKLKVLDIDLEWCSTEIIEILYDELDNVRSLTISMDESWHYPAGCPYIYPLLPSIEPIDSAVHLRVPRLETLSISHISLQYHVEVICEVVQQRHDAGYPIKTLNVVGTCNVDEVDKVWFEENVETFVFTKVVAER